VLDPEDFDARVRAAAIAQPVYGHGFEHARAVEEVALLAHPRLRAQFVVVAPAHERFADREREQQPEAERDCRAEPPRHARALGHGILRIATGFTNPAGLHSVSTAPVFGSRRNNAPGPVTFWP